MVNLESVEQEEDDIERDGTTHINVVFPNGHGRRLKRAMGGVRQSQPQMGKTERKAEP